MPPVRSDLWETPRSACAERAVGQGRGTLPKAWARTIGRSQLLAVGVILITAATFIFVEGLSSVLYLSRGLSRPLAERVHTRYDDLLGWVNVPDLHRPDMYGKGIGFRSNKQGFRNDRDFAVSVPLGKTRIICS